MRNIIFGGIGVLWGAGVLIYMLVNSNAEGRGPFAGGQVVGWVLGVLLFGVGLFYLIDGIRKLNHEEQPKKRKKKKKRLPRVEED